MSDDVFEIEVLDGSCIGKWAFDSLTLEPLYNPDGSRKRQRIRITNADDPHDYEDFEVLDVRPSREVAP